MLFLCLLQSFLHLRLCSFFLLLLLLLLLLLFFFWQNVSSNTIRKACQIFILFLEFSKSYMFAMIYAMLYAYVLFLIYECMNTRESKC